MSYDAPVSRLKPRPAPNVPSRLPSLTGARFIAAGLVFGFHAGTQSFFTSPGAQKTLEGLFGQGGWAGVTFFFVLSGFVLTWAMRPGDTAPTFWRRRFFKIYPTHLITLVAAGVLLAVVTKAAFSGWNGVLNLLLIQSWSPDLAVRISFNEVAWSLSCEALFYLCFPFLIKLVGRVRPERLWFWAIMSAAAVISMASFALLMPPGPTFPGTGFTTWQLWLVFHFPPTQLPEFVFGMFLARIVLTGRRLPLQFGGAVALTIGAYFVSALAGPLYQFSAVMVVPLGLLIAAGASADVAGQRTFLGSKLMVWLGEISFAFYMWHYLVLSYGHQWLGKNWGTATATGALILLFAAAVVLAWASFTFVERPIMKRFATSRRRRGLALVTTTTTGTADDVRTDKAA